MGFFVRGIATAIEQTRLRKICRFDGVRGYFGRKVFATTYFHNCWLALRPTKWLFVWSASFIHVVQKFAKASWMDDSRHQKKEEKGRGAIYPFDFLILGWLKILSERRICNNFERRAVQNEVRGCFLPLYIDRCLPQLKNKKKYRSHRSFSFFFPPFTQHFCTTDLEHYQTPNYINLLGRTLSAPKNRWKLF